MTLEARLKVDYYVGGALHLLIKPFVVLFGLLMRRDHRLEAVKEINVLKLLGGGSLVIAYPSLLALKARAAPGRFRLITLAPTRPFAELLGIFDEIIVIRDGDGSLVLFFDTLRAIRRLWRCEALIDFEVHSRLSTLFCLFTCARNRVGFYTQESFWRRSLSTHLLFFHLNSGVYFFYEQVARVFGVEPVSFGEAGERFRKTLGLDQIDISSAGSRLAIAPSCSGLGRERMIHPAEWAAVFYKRMHPETIPSQIDLLGAPSDDAELEKIRRALQKVAPTAVINNHAGKTSLLESIRLMWIDGELLAIDSALLNIASLLGIASTSWWGPTAPDTRLRVLKSNSTIARQAIHYFNLPCSPCVHLTPTPPCHGNNICMRLAVNPDATIDRNPPWLARDWNQDPQQVESQTQLVLSPTDAEPPE